jgi:hypothetical protein
MSVTDAQLNANRQNAQQSTGPRTPDGKQRSRLNATRHSLTGQVLVTTEEDKAAYDKHCRGFFEDWQPRSNGEKHLVQTLADKQWQMHHASALLQSIQVLGHVELQDKIDVEHPEIHAALTAGLVAMDKCKQLDLISRYASRLQRDYSNALKNLQVLQAQRKQQEVQEFEEAALLRTYYQMEEIPFIPAEFGFVLSLHRIDTYNRRTEALAKARIARDLNFNREKYRAAVQ